MTVWLSALRDGRATKWSFGVIRWPAGGGAADQAFAGGPQADGDGRRGDLLILRGRGAWLERSAHEPASVEHLLRRRNVAKVTAVRERRGSRSLRGS